MAVLKSGIFDWGTCTTSSSTDNAYLTQESIQRYIDYAEGFRNERENYYRQFYSTWRYEQEPVKKIDDEISIDLKSQYAYAVEEKIEPSKVFMFDPINLWSEPKCLITDIVQSAKQKSQSGITSKINISELQTEK